MQTTADDKRLNAEEGIGWINAYMAAGFTREEAMQILVASVGRPLPPDINERPLASDREVISDREAPKLS